MLNDLESKAFHKKTGEFSSNHSYIKPNTYLLKDNEDIIGYMNSDPHNYISKELNNSHHNKHNIECSKSQNHQMKLKQDVSDLKYNNYLLREKYCLQNSLVNKYGDKYMNKIEGNNSSNSPNLNSINASNYSNSNSNKSPLVNKILPKSNSSNYLAFKKIKDMRSNVIERNNLTKLRKKLQSGSYNNEG